MPTAISSLSDMASSLSDSLPVTLSKDNALYTTAGLAALLTSLSLLRTYHHNRQRRSRSTQLSGPPSPSLVWGVGRALSQADDAVDLWEEWRERYGGVFRAPAAFGAERVILMDPAAIAHFYAQETWTYVQGPIGKQAIEHLVGKGVLWADGEDHRRQRRALSAGFTNAAIRKMTPVFFDSAYKAKAAWDAILEASPDDHVVLDVQNWMNHISLDSIGLAGFSHDFASLAGTPSPVADVFDLLGTVKPNVLSAIRFLIGPSIPLLRKIPTKHDALIRQLHVNMERLADELLERNKREREEGVAEDKGDKSIMGLLIQSEGSKLTKEEVLAQMKTLMLAGYETTSISLTHCLIELAKQPQLQAKLRAELQTQYPASDPSWDELQINAGSPGLDYLDAVVHETLRMHAPLQETNRVARTDDIIPLSTPLPNPNPSSGGGPIDRVAIADGTRVTVPIDAVNRSTAIWGPDARVFRPERWLEEGGIGAEETKLAARNVQGYRHLLTFVDGPRTCLGKAFAVAEFKAVLSVLIRNYSFELPNGPETKIGRHSAILRRPKVEGEEGARVPMKIRPVERG